MTRKLSEKHVVVFGGASGIGYETIRLLVEEGAYVTAADLIADKGAEFQAEFAGKVGFIQCDVSAEDNVRHVYDLASKISNIQSVINCAGMQLSGNAETMDLDDWNRIMAVNAGGAFLVAKHAVPHLCHSGGGAIVLVSSTAAHRGGPKMTAYSASKGAIVSFGRALAMELGSHNIRVNVVCPGWTDTAFNGPIIETLGGIEARDAMLMASVPLQRQAHPREIAQMNLYLASDASSYVTGQSIVVDGGLI